VDRTKQGVGGSPSGRILGSVPEKWYNGARIGPGLGMVWIGKTGVPGDGFYGVERGNFWCLVLGGPGPEIF